jgi:hypothetical protein
MEPPTRRSIFEQASKRLRANFQELSVIPHAGSKGAEGEAIVRQFLNDHMPQRFRAGSGFIIDRRDAVSKQTDVVVYDALNCPVYRASETAAIFPANNVAAVVEVKSRLDKVRLEEAAANIAAAKSLRKARARADGPVAQLEQTRGIVFAFGCEMSTDTVLDHYHAMTMRHGMGKHIDMIVVLDQFIAQFMVNVPGLDGWGFAYLDGPGNVEGSIIGIGTYPTRQNTLDAFLRLLLPQLILFRPMVDFPGFEWSPDDTAVGEPRIMFLGVVSLEKDPEKRAANQRKHRDRARKLFGSDIPEGDA